MNWSHFAKSYWEKKAVLLDQSMHGQMIGPENLFRIFLDVAEKYRSGKIFFEALWFFIGPQRVLARSEVIRLLPKNSDRNFEAYEKRVTRLIGGQRFGLLIDAIQTYDFDLWSEFCRFLKKLYSEIGMPTERASVSLFMGNYKCTPFGVHIDNDPIFKFVILGQKTLRLWKKSIWEKRFRDQLRYKSYLNEAQSLTASAEQSMFWPSNRYHVAESHGFSVSLSLGFTGRLREGASHIMLESCNSILRDRLEHFDKSFFPFQSKNLSLPADLQNCYRELVKKPVIPSDAILEGLWRTWLCRLSSFGFEQFPDVLSLRSNKCLPKNAVIEPCSVQFSWIKIPELRKFFFAANGHVRSLPLNAQTAPWEVYLKRIESGEPISKVEWEAPSLHKNKKQLFMSKYHFLNQLLEIRAVRIKRTA